jgi:hypothetical protein
MKRIIPAALAAVMVLSLSACGQKLPTAGSADATVGDAVIFGAYEQDNNTGNGAEDIEWIVLAEEDGRQLLISKKGLDCVQYHDTYESVTWETSTIREWLNDEFYNTAFTDEQKAQIVETMVTADANPDETTDAGNDTTDNVFLLSIDEVNEYMTDVEVSKCVPTKYAKAQGVYNDSSGDACWWWVRTPGSNVYRAAVVGNNGHPDSSGTTENYAGNAVRPAIWIEKQVAEQDN